LKRAKTEITVYFFCRWNTKRKIASRNMFLYFQSNFTRKDIGW